ncbi:CotD family spore coat protein [Pradoshia sp.]
MHGHHGHHGHHNFCGPISIPGCNQTQVCPPVCHEPIQYVKENCYTVVVPHVHPVHTLEVNNHVFQHEHTFPHTYQSVNPVFNQETQFGGPMPGGPGCCGPGQFQGQGQFFGQGPGFGR